MKHLILTLALLVSIPAAVCAQSDPLLKKLEKASSLYNDGKTDKAEAQVEELLNDHPDYGKGWDLLIAMRRNDYDNAKKYKITVSTGKGSKSGVTDKEGNEVKGLDSLVSLLDESLKSLDPAAMARSHYDYTLRKALLNTSEAASASMIWRSEKIDPEVDSNTNRKALRYFQEGEKEYANRNYRAAALQYQRALEEQPDFYKARLYMGDAFYGGENYSDAIATFKACIEKFPDLLEPRKYLVDAYGKMSLYEKAVEEAIATMTVYPDNSMVMKLDDAAYLANKTVDIKWTRRLVFPNRIKPGELKSDLNGYSGKAEKPTAPWSFYIGALESIGAHYNEQGIRKSESDDVHERYLEVQSWSEMLRKSQDASLAEARRMQQAGYLDCYVLVTCFHPDFYEQYRDFSRANADKIVRYYKKFLKDRS